MKLLHRYLLQKSMKINIKETVIFIITVLVLLLGCSKNPPATQEVRKGIIHGRVTVGPIRPVQRNDAPPEDASKWYKGKSILIFSEDKKTLLAAVPLDENGNFRFSLEPGSYIIDMKLQSIERISTSLPKELEIKAGETLGININVDTGIR